MAGDDNLLDDDYVAKLLEKDAKELRGMFNLSTSSPSKPPNKSKPNTRFLRNIIKETDSHNAALLAKEAADAQARLKDLTAQESQKKVTRAPLDVRKRQLGDIAAILGGGSVKRKRVARGENREGKGTQRNPSNEAHEAAKREDSRTQEAKEDAPEKLKERISREDDRRKDERSRSPRSRNHHRNYSRDKPRDPEDSKRNGSILSEKESRRHHAQKGGRDEIRKRSSKDDYSDEDERERRHKRHRRHRSTSRESGRDLEEKELRRRPRHSRSRSPHERREQDFKIRSKSPRRRRSKSPDGHHQKSRRSRRSPSRERKSLKGEKQKSSLEEETYDSDPLSSIIGPLPPKKPELKTRGRGTFSHNAGIDSRFSADYDPAADVVPDDDEENDWDQALEALRDRTKWKQQGADRLKAAGFTDDEIHKWKKGGEKTEEDVRWSKKGESREWDIGKIFDEAGGVSIEPKFGRLKDN